MFDRAKPEKLKTILKAIRNFAQYGEVPDFGEDEALNLVWPQLEQKLIADDESFERKREQRVNAANKRWEKEREKSSKNVRTDADGCESIRNMPTTSTSTPTTTSTSTTIDSVVDKPQRTRFKPPTLEEVQAYCQERNNCVDPQRFIDYYASNGWKVGRNSMKDWKAAVRSWERKDEERQRNTQQKRDISSYIRPEDYDTDEKPW